MHGAPSVSYPVGRSRNADRLLWGVWAIGACCAAAGSYHLDSAGWRAGLLVLSVIAAAVAISRGALLHRATSSELRFDGQYWAFAGAPALRTARAAVALDFQSLLLVCLTEPRRRRCWVWVDRRAMPERWQDFRRAVYSRPPSADQAPEPGRARPVSAHHPLP
ncbi:MAG: hypothetical protein EOP82_22265 [Variovorax sp.]|nr:MAG: hypothetical protein EOP82_22265 [Variovorax sp.]